MRHLLLIASGFLLVTAGLSFGPAAGLAGADAHLVENDAIPRDGVFTFQLRELWRAGEDDPDYLLGLITDAQADSHGNVYLVDFQLSDVKVFAPNGDYLHTLSRQGEGPGETEAARQLLLAAGGELGIVQG